MTTYEADLILVSTTLKHASLGRECLITYACEDQAAVGAPTTLANTIQDAFADIWNPQLDTNVTIGPTSVLLGDGSSTGLIGTSTIAPVAGTRALASIPPNNNMLIKKRTNFSGRENRGRVYLPWSFDEAGIDEVGNLTGGEVSGAQTRASAWLARLLADNTRMCIANRVYDLPWTNPARTLLAVNSGRQVTTLVVDGLIASQRRRIGR